MGLSTSVAPSLSPSLSLVLALSPPTQTYLHHSPQSNHILSISFSLSGHREEKSVCVSHSAAVQLHFPACTTHSLTRRDLFRVWNYNVLLFCGVQYHGQA